MNVYWEHVRGWKCRERWRCHCEVAAEHIRNVTGIMTRFFIRIKYLNSIYSVIVENMMLRCVQGLRTPHTHMNTWFPVHNDDFNITVQHWETGKFLLHHSEVKVFFIWLMEGWGSPGLLRGTSPGKLHISLCVCVCMWMCVCVCFLSSSAACACRVMTNDAFRGRKINPTEGDRKSGEVTAWISVHTTNWNLKSVQRNQTTSID